MWNNREKINGKPLSKAEWKCKSIIQHNTCTVGPTKTPGALLSTGSITTDRIWLGNIFPLLSLTLNVRTSVIGSVPISLSAMYL